MFLNVSRSTVYDYLHKGELRRYGRTRKVSCQSLAFITGSKDMPGIVFEQVMEVKAATKSSGA